MTLKIIGAGLGRTGTLSLKQAIDALNLGPCHHMMEVFKHPEQPALWAAAADGSPDWEKVFAGYRAAVDWPVAGFYRDMLAEYPDAKFILTVRDPERWFVSTQETIFRFMEQRLNDPADAWGRMIRKVIVEPMGGDLHDRAKLIEHYLAHNEAVAKTIPAKQLLTYRVADGWAPLCAFLGVPEPDLPFPNVNSTEEFKARAPGRPPGGAAAALPPAH